jgi:hypothetical protein
MADRVIEYPTGGEEGRDRPFPLRSLETVVQLGRRALLILPEPAQLRGPFEPVSRKNGCAQKPASSQCKGAA